MRYGIALAAFVAAGCAASASADLVAYWNFNASTPNSTGGQLGVLNSTAPDLGAGTLSIGGGLTYNTVSAGTANGAVGTFAGSTLNVVGADPSGGALSIQGGVGGSGPVTSNGGWVQFQLNLSSFENVVLTFAGRGTSTGFGSPTDKNNVLISTDGVSFSPLAQYESRQTTFSLYTFNLGPTVDGAATAYVRLELRGATGSAGNNRIDNVQFNGDLIPAPASLALLGLGGLVAGRRRR